MIKKADCPAILVRCRAENVEIDKACQAQATGFIAFAAAACTCSATLLRGARGQDQRPLSSARSSVLQASGRIRCAG